MISTQSKFWFINYTDGGSEGGLTRLRDAVYIAEERMKSGREIKNITYGTRNTRKWWEFWK